MNTITRKRMSAKELYEFDSKSNSELKQKDKENTLAVYSFELNTLLLRYIQSRTNTHSYKQNLPSSHFNK